MAVTPNSIITPQTPFVAFADLQAVTAVTTRATLSAATTLVAFSPFTNNNGKQINSITVKNTGTSVSTVNAAQLVLIYQYDNNSKYWLVDEIPITSVTPSTTAPSFYTQIFYSGWVIPASHLLYACTTVTTTVGGTGFIVSCRGGDL
jgi:hypothetical protein